MGPKVNNPASDENTDRLVLVLMEVLLESFTKFIM